MSGCVFFSAVAMSECVGRCAAACVCRHIKCVGEVLAWAYLSFPSAISAYRCSRNRRIKITLDKWQSFTVCSGAEFWGKNMSTEVVECPCFLFVGGSGCSQQQQVSAGRSSMTSVRCRVEGRSFCPSLQQRASRPSPRLLALAVFLWTSRDGLISEELHPAAVQSCIILLAGAQRSNMTDVDE